MTGLGPCQHMTATSNREHNRGYFFDYCFDYVYVAVMIGSGPYQSMTAESNQTSNQDVFPITFRLRFGYFPITFWVLLISVWLPGRRCRDRAGAVSTRGREK